MDVTVLLFGPAALAIGRREVGIRVAEGATCGDVGRAIVAVEPLLGRFLEAGRLAVNHTFAEPEQLVRAGDEVALIAMVSGG